ncbi:MAG: hypothetical protein HRU03_09350 [Nanoarchaeales archaeon]|nr:hypothetical protein [Nanoarchaeales archaeon]
MNELVEIIKEYNLQEIVNIGVGTALGVSHCLFDNFSKYKNNIFATKDSATKENLGLVVSSLVVFNKNQEYGFGLDLTRTFTSSISGVVSYGCAYAFTDHIISKHKINKFWEKKDEKEEE